MVCGVPVPRQPLALTVKVAPKRRLHCKSHAATLTLQPEVTELVLSFLEPSAYRATARSCVLKMPLRRRFVLLKEEPASKKLRREGPAAAAVRLGKHTRRYLRKAPAETEAEGQQEEEEEAEEEEDEEEEIDTEEEGDETEPNVESEEDQDEQADVRQDMVEQSGEEDSEMQEEDDESEGDLREEATEKCQVCREMVVSHPRDGDINTGWQQVLVASMEMFLDLKTLPAAAGPWLLSRSSGKDMCICNSCLEEVLLEDETEDPRDLPPWLRKASA
ncbi:unnamed protein product [Polarella glacialis]|uniref:Uncharacterized protein n=1 Tax=Polarella glacialis TaxID=89957 RepID=A0A813HC48_POLGL|nr:unnamed protein product [Polarella glacialis]|mmetsp:Transcript_70340/g.126786  ORF Transcript_70340/g.126786 Transcript_70340/m.126786 type:complete len:275 (-) Transcript_70340:247-1071(-)